MAPLRTGCLLPPEPAPPRARLWARVLLLAVSVPSCTKMAPPAPDHRPTTGAGHSSVHAVVATAARPAAKASRAGLSEPALPLAKATVAARDPPPPPPPPKPPPPPPMSSVRSLFQPSAAAVPPFDVAAAAGPRPSPPPPPPPNLPPPAAAFIGVLVRKLQLTNCPPSPPKPVPPLLRRCRCCTRVVHRCRRCRGSARQRG